MSLDEKEFKFEDTPSLNNDADKQAAENGCSKVESGASCAAYKTLCFLTVVQFFLQRQLQHRPQNPPRTGIIVPQYGGDATSTTEPSVEASASQNPPRSGIIVPHYLARTAATTEPAIGADVPSTDVATTMIEQLCMLLYTT